MIDVANPKGFQIDEIYEIVRMSASNYSEVGMGKVVRIKGNSVALQIINGTIQVNDKIKYNE
jgi:hypothetical protein